MAGSGERRVNQRLANRKANPAARFARPPHAPPHPGRPRKRRLRADRAAIVSHEKDIHARRRRLVHCNPRFVIMSRREKHLGFETSGFETSGFETTSREIAEPLAKAGVVSALCRRRAHSARDHRQSPRRKIPACRFAARNPRQREHRILSTTSLALLGRRRLT
jgi:hypothetical protein